MSNMRDAIGFCMFVYFKHLQTIYKLQFTVSQYISMVLTTILLRKRHAIVLQVSSPTGSCQEISKYEKILDIEVLEVYRNATNEAVCHGKK